tara:strand:- start:25 stop:462 length:438 start_codon:yes stop_codon:yes gene_type:complete
MWELICTMGRMQFFIPSDHIPTAAKQQKSVAIKNGKPVLYNDPSYHSACAWYESRLAQHRPNQPLEGPLQLQVSFIYPATKDHPHGTYKTTKPDTDNLLSGVKDTMQAIGFFDDDCVVAREITEKLYGDVSGIFFRLTELFPAAR